MLAGNTAIESMGGPVVGTLRVGARSVDFHVGTPRGLRAPEPEKGERNFLLSPVDGAEKQRVTVVDLASGLATDVSLGTGWAAVLSAKCRKAKERELRKQEATESLIKAEQGTKHSFLHSQILRARVASVELCLLERATAKLATLDVSAPEGVAEALVWGKVTKGDGVEVGERCGHAPSAPLPSHTRAHRTPTALDSRGLAWGTGGGNEAHLATLTRSL